MSAVDAKRASAVKFLVFSAIGAIAFFVPIEISGKSTIPIDHLVSFVIAKTPIVGAIYAFSLILWGVSEPFLRKTWRDSVTTAILSVLQILAIPLSLMFFIGQGPAAFMAPDVLPFLFERLAVPVGLVIPIGAIFLTFLIGFGLLEAIGVFMEPVMRPCFKTPGRAAVDAVASFAGSYSVGLLITSRVYKEKLYSAKEAATIATGFSTVSATFMVIVAKTLTLTEFWNAYFFGTLVVTFIVTAITVRLPPLARMDNQSDAQNDTKQAHHSYLRASLSAGLAAAENAEKFAPLLVDNFLSGLRMASRVVPSILSIGFLGLMAAKYTPIFEFLGWLFTPVLWLFYPDNASEIGSVVASGLAEMFLPAVQGVGFDLSTRFVIGVVSVSSILFLSASIPCILATGIPLTLNQMLLIWFVRTVLSIPIAVGVGWLLGVT